MSRWRHHPHSTRPEFSSLYRDERFVCNMRTEHAEAIVAMADALAKAEADNAALRRALEGARPYVAEAVREDGGIDNCEIGLRVDLEAVDAALRPSRSGADDE